MNNNLLKAYSCFICLDIKYVLPLILNTTVFPVAVVVVAPAAVVVAAAAVVVVVGAAVVVVVGAAVVVVAAAATVVATVTPISDDDPRTVTPMPPTPTPIC